MNTVRKSTLTLVIHGLLLFMLLSCNNGNRANDQPYKNNGPRILSHSILNAYPHDTSAYTQGLDFYNGELYEGTGLVGKSRLRKVDLQTGNILREIRLDTPYFGEGITILRDTIYQLTWQNSVVFVYTLNDFRKVKEFSINTEGWGITNDGNNLIVSTGGGDLYFYEPSDFKLVKKLDVMSGNEPAFNLNELEYIDGYVYANQYLYPYVLKIDPMSGQVVSRFDLNDMWNRVKAINPEADVPNGIAYDEVTKKIYVTGKLWPEIYEIQLGQ